MQPINNSQAGLKLFMFKTYEDIGPLIRFPPALSASSCVLDKWTLLQLSYLFTPLML